MASKLSYLCTGAKMTTLTASIEKMKEALNEYKDHLDGNCLNHPDCLDQALDSAPAQPKTEDEIVCLISNRSSIGSREVFRALKEAGCLYCAEGK